MDPKFTAEVIILNIDRAQRQALLRVGAILYPERLPWSTYPLGAYSHFFHDVCFPNAYSRRKEMLLKTQYHF